MQLVHQCTFIQWHVRLHTGACTQLQATSLHACCVQLRAIARTCMQLVPSIQVAWLCFSTIVQLHAVAKINNIVHTKCLCLRDPSRATPTTPTAQTSDPTSALLLKLTFLTSSTRAGSEQRLTIDCSVYTENSLTVFLQQLCRSARLQPHFFLP